MRKPNIRCVDLKGKAGDMLIGVWVCEWVTPNVQWEGYGITPLDAYNMAKRTPILFPTPHHIEAIKAAGRFRRM